MLRRSLSPFNVFRFTKGLGPVASRIVSSGWRATTIRYMGAWGKELEPHVLAPASNIVNVHAIEEAMEDTKSAAKDSNRVKEILSTALDKALLKTPKGHDVIPSADPQHEFVQGLNLEEAATLLNLDPATQPDLLNELYHTALSIKERIYGNRIVLFAPLYLSNFCVNSCTYCAFRGKNKHIPRSMLTNDQLVAEVEALQHQGHRRLLMLTGEHPKVRVSNGKIILTRFPYTHFNVTIVHLWSLFGRDWHCRQCPNRPMWQYSSNQRWNPGFICFRLKTSQSHRPRGNLYTFPRNLPPRSL